MSMVEALRRCPHLIVVSGRHETYAEVSHQIFEVFRQYTPLVQGLSLDEAFLDVTEDLRLHRPQVGLRWNRNTPADLLMRAVRILRTNS